MSARGGVLRRLGFGTALATGLTLLGISFGGLASLDGDLRAAAEQTPGGERVRIELRDCPLERHRQTPPASSGREA